MLVQTRTTHTQGTAATPGQRGFTLLEMLLALTVGSLLVTSLASGLQLFGEELETVREESDARLEEVAVQISDRVRDAWWADVPAAGQLQLSDPDGNVTSYALVGDELRVTRPNGAQGVLLDGVASASFDVDTVQRLRDDTPATVTGPWYSQPAPLGPEVELVIGPGDGLALGFWMSDDAPDSVNTVSGVEEERLSASMDSITLTCSFLFGGLKEFCHIHASPPHNPTHPGYTGNRLIAELYEARSPGDARPHGPMLGTVDIAADDLPATDFIWWDTSLDEQAYPPDSIWDQGGPDKCKDDDGDNECDFPGKKHHHNPLDVPGGVAWGWWHQHPDVELILSPTESQVVIDLSAFGVDVEPGRAYSVVLRVEGWDEVRVPAVPVFTSSGSGVAYRSAGGDFLQAAVGIEVALSGDQLCTQTAATDAVSRVSVDLTLDDGRTIRASSPVQGQVAVSDPWRGVIPNQVGDVGP